MHECSTQQEPNFNSIQSSCLSFLAVMVTLQVSPVQNITSPIIGNKYLINRYNVLGLCLILLSSIIIALSGNIVSGKYYHIIYTPTLMLSIATLIICHTYYIKRSHKYGALLSSKQIGKATTILCCVLYFVSSATTNYDTTTILPFFLGSLTVSGMSVFFAAVADCWYTVGTGQFFMVSLDTAGILFYFVLPVTILLLRFVDKYQSLVHNVILSLASLITKQLLQGSGVDYNLDKVLILFLSFTTMMGIVLIQNLCPMSGHLFGRVYTHGYPNTKRVAICVNFSEYKKELEETVMTRRQSEKEDSHDILNVFVSLNELKEYTELVRKLHELGYHIGLRLSGNDGGSSLVLNETYTEYEKLLGLKPISYHTGMDHSGKLPSCYQSADSLGMDCISWSMIVTSVKDVNDSVNHELKAHGGGSIIFLSTDNSQEIILKSTLDLLNESGMKSDTLKNLLKNANQMTMDL